MSMPPKDLFTPTKIFIKPADKPEVDWKELVGSIVSDSITITREAPDPFVPTTLRLVATININHKNRIRLLKSVGLMKRPRLTYETVRRDRAKRNRFT